MKAMQGPCQTDYTNQREVVAKFRDFFCVGHLLQWDVEQELSKFRKKLLVVGWGQKQIALFQQYATKNTQWETLIPRPIREVGDQATYRDNNYRGS